MQNNYNNNKKINNNNVHNYNKSTACYLLTAQNHTESEFYLFIREYMASHDLCQSIPLMNRFLSIQDGKNSSTYFRLEQDWNFVEIELCQQISALNNTGNIILKYSEPHLL